MAKVFFLSTCHWFFLFEVNSYTIFKKSHHFDLGNMPSSMAFAGVQRVNLMVLSLSFLIKKERGSWERGFFRMVLVCVERREG